MDSAVGSAGFTGASAGDFTAVVVSMVVVSAVMVAVAGADNNTTRTDAARERIREKSLTKELRRQPVQPGARPTKFNFTQGRLASAPAFTYHAGV